MRQLSLQNEGLFSCSWSGAWPQWTPPASSKKQDGVCFQDTSLTTASGFRVCAPLLAGADVSAPSGLANGTQSPPPLLQLLKGDPRVSLFSSWLAREKLDATLAQVETPVTVRALRNDGSEGVPELFPPCRRCSPSATRPW